MENLRTAIILDSNGETLRRVSFADLKKGDTFQLEEASGRLAHNGDVLITLSDSRKSEVGFFVVDVDNPYSVKAQ